MAVIDSGSSSAGKANVDAAYNLQVALPNTHAYIGGVRIHSENDSGDHTGVPYLKSPETSPDYRARIGVDTVLFNDVFNATLQNTSLWSYTFNTLTAAQTGLGTVNFSTVQGTTNAHGAFMRTFQYFPLVNTAPLAIEFYFGQFTAQMVSNEVWLMGIGLPTAATTITTDGVWMRLSTAGLQGVIAFNGALTTTSFTVAKPMADFATNTMHKALIVIGEREVEYWIDDVLIGEQDIPADNGVPWLSGSQPAFMMKYNTGNVTNTNMIRVSRVGVTLMDVATAKPWAQAQSGMGMNSAVLQNGMNSTTVVPTTAGNTNQLILPTTQAGSNSAPNAAMLGLGGQFLMTAQATNVAAAGDMIGCSYANPVPSINITGRNLYITGVSIACANTGAAVATTPTLLVWGLAWGHTNVSLATLETGTFVTGTTHSPRRIPLGMCSAAVGTPIGGMYDREINRTFDAPIVVRPGEFIATTVRFRVGTATASQEVFYTVMFNGYWE
jgi:hypothetical protein